RTEARNGGEGARRRAGALRKHMPQGRLVALAGPDRRGALDPGRLRLVGSAAERELRVRRGPLAPPPPPHPPPPLAPPPPPPPPSLSFRPAAPLSLHLLLLSKGLLSVLLPRPGGLRRG